MVRDPHADACECLAALRLERSQLRRDQLDGDVVQLVSADVGKRMIFRVTGTNSVGSATADSVPTGVVQAQSSPPANPANLCLNPGFETNPLEYSFYGTGTPSWASDAAHTGSRSVKIVSSDGTLNRWTQWFSVTGGQRYDVSTWVKDQFWERIACSQLLERREYSGVSYETADVTAIGRRSRSASSSRVASTACAWSCGRASRPERGGSTTSK